MESRQDSTASAAFKASSEMEGQGTIARLKPSSYFSLLQSKRATKGKGEFRKKASLVEKHLLPKKPMKLEFWA